MKIRIIINFFKKEKLDWQQPAADIVVERVLSKLQGGAIILAHPTECTLAALPRIIAAAQDQGYSFVTVSENLGL